jgi:hypothetical protein
VLMEGHERDDVPLGRARHGLLPGNLPLLGAGERRELPGLDEAAQHRAGHIGPRPVRHGGSKLSNETTAQAVMVQRAQGSERSGMQRQGKKARE